MKVHTLQVVVVRNTPTHFPHFPNNESIYTLSSEEAVRAIQAPWRKKGGDEKCMNLGAA